jgi:hypothetical protein
LTLPTAFSHRFSSCMLLEEVEYSYDRIVDLRRLSSHLVLRASAHTGPFPLHLIFLPAFPVGEGQIRK